MKDIKTCIIMIENGFSFSTIQPTISLPTHFQDEISKISELSKETPLVLDTNILLRLYSIPLKRKEKLIRFFQERVHQIFIPQQVKKEFLRHRQQVMLDFLPWVYQEEYPSLKNPLVLDIKRFFDKPTEEKKTKILKQINFQKKLIEKLQQDDPVLQLIESSHTLPSLSKTEFLFLKNEFSILSKDKKSPMFPGKGDIALKQRNQIGDFLIFHEMLKLMKTKNESVVFFTVDTSKGDWLDKQKKPHQHYLEKTHQSTENYLVVVDGTRWLEKKFKLHLDPFPLLSEQKLSNNLNNLCNNLLVIHSTFGKGKVKELYNSQGKEMVCVDFEKVGEKRLLKEFSKLQVISSITNFSLA